MPSALADELEPGVLPAIVFTALTMPPAMRAMTMTQMMKAASEARGRPRKNPGSTASNRPSSDLPHGHTIGAADRKNMAALAIATFRILSYVA
jgi:hypothetical protein